MSKFNENILLFFSFRILATHHTKFLWSADSAILFKDGAIVSQGPPEEVLVHKDFVGKDYDVKDVAMAIDDEVGLIIILILN